MEVQAQISHAKLRAKVGRTVRVLIDEMQGTTAIGRSEADAPEIDGIVRVKAAKGVKPGDFLAVRITAANDHDLQGSAVGK